MSSASTMFRTHRVKKGVLLCALAIGVLGCLSGVWLLYSGGSSAALGLIGGLANIAIGGVGLYKLKHR